MKEWEWFGVRVEKLSAGAIVYGPGSLVACNRNPPGYAGQRGHPWKAVREGTESEGKLKTQARRGQGPRTPLEIQAAGIQGLPPK